ncbi:protein of unknown function (plasmid) [Azospirillum baldaniorum]|uniref:Uncharacterized protein n=1 Tax=Azospirillum baldaniorum TaxID=1064539 RepID=A0A9P1K041_9PROT|nr:protein of unknown function [Azospirillum baldaniorum]
MAFLHQIGLARHDWNRTDGRSRLSRAGFGRDRGRNYLLLSFGTAPAMADPPAGRSP